VTKTFSGRFSGGFGPGRAGGGIRRQERGRHQSRPHDRDGVHHLDHVDRPDGRDNRLAVRQSVADQGQAQQRTMAARAPAVHPGHHVEQRGRGQRHVREQRSVGV